jgi:hypothetical protein
MKFKAKTDNDQFIFRVDLMQSIWTKNNMLHRDKGPAAISYNADRYWYQNDRLSREDGPAIIHRDGTEYWYCRN